LYSNIKEADHKWWLSSGKPENPETLQNCMHGSRIGYNLSSVVQIIQLCGFSCLYVCYIDLINHNTL
jgi:hypothetical protein